MRETECACGCGREIPLAATDNAAANFLGCGWFVLQVMNPETKKAIHFGLMEPGCLRRFVSGTLPPQPIRAQLLRVPGESS